MKFASQDLSNLNLNGKSCSKYFKTKCSKNNGICDILEINRSAIEILRLFNTINHRVDVFIVEHVTNRHSMDSAASENVVSKTHSTHSSLLLHFHEWLGKRSMHYL